MKAASTAARPAATKQTLAPVQQNVKPVVYMDTNGEEVSLTLSLLNNVLSPGGRFTQNVADMYFGMCKYLHLNPVKKECYLVEYGGKPTIVITRDCYNDRAKKCKEYQGKESGVCFMDKNGVYGERLGTILLPGETLLGAFCKVYMKDRVVPETVTVSFDEVKRVGTNGELQSTWRSQPNWMCVKVAESRCLKAAIPEYFAGTYSPEELGEEEPTSSIPQQYQDVAYTDMNTGEVIEPDDDEPSIFDTEG